MVPKASNVSGQLLASSSHRNHDKKYEEKHQPFAYEAEHLDSI